MLSRRLGLQVGGSVLGRSRPGRGIYALGASRRFLSSDSGSQSKSTYFDLFPNTFPDGGPPKGPYKIDTAALKREYLQLQNKSHPDRASTAEESDRLSTISSQLSVAYRALLDPMRRAENILLSRGVDALAEKDSLTEHDLLMDVLMAREAIAEAESEEELEAIRRENDVRLVEAETNLEEAFQQDDLELARSEIVKLSYWSSIKKQLDELSF